MDLDRALTWKPPVSWRRLTVIDSHTGGEPFRVVIDGLPEIPGETVLQRRRHAMEEFDGLRRALMWEPRGHADMYGGWIGPPVSTESDLSVLFVHNDGFSTMCGHGIIALSKVLIDTGTIRATEPETTIRIDTPAGPVVATSTVSSGVVTETRFRNVPSFVVDLDASVEIEGLGRVGYDLAFGGAFYAIVEAKAVGLTVQDASELVAAGRDMKAAISASRELSHRDHPDLGFLYGVIFTGPASEPSNHSRNVCVFADGEVDRSPTGTGVSARLAVLSARGVIGLGDEIVVESIVGSTFRAKIAERLDANTIVPEVAGSAHIVGRSEFWFDPDDPLGDGFLVR